MFQWPFFMFGGSLARPQGDSNAQFKRCLNRKYLLKQAYFIFRAFFPRLTAK